MAKRSKRRPPKRQAIAAGQSPAELSATAQDALERGRYRDAIGAFKEVLKTHDHASGREGLAAAYAGRAAELTAKGMLKEALAVWKNRQQLGEAAAPHGEHLALLMRLGHTTEALQTFDPTDPALPPEIVTALRSQLAARYLAGDDTLATRLPTDDPIGVHGQAARTALAAYCNGDNPALELALASIPFRSPYRDVVQILKALQCLATDRARAAKLLAGVADTSAFAVLRRAAELALVPEPELTARLATAGTQSRRFALTLRGWGAERIALYEEAARLGPDPQPKALLPLLERHRRRLGEAWTRRQGLRLLIDQFPQSMKWLAQIGARASASEQALVAAWKAEQRHDDPWDVMEGWGRLALKLEAEGPCTPGSDQALGIALTLRRFDKISDILAPENQRQGLDMLADEVVQQLDSSLAFDPDDLDTYLRLSACYRGSGALKEARQALEAALSRWPDDVRVLTEALDTAVASGAFSKATTLARRILKLDPINRGVRGRLVQAHLDHALRRIRTKRLDLAGRELHAAAEWDQMGQFSDRLAIAQGLLDLTAEPSQGSKALRALIGRLGDGLATRHTVATLALAAGRKPKPLFKTLGLGAPRATDADDLMTLLQQLRESFEGETRLSADILGYLDKALQAAARLPLSRQNFEHACETLRLYGWPIPRLAFARAALKQWDEEPLFVFHRLEAEYGNQPWAANYAAMALIDRALERSQASGDNRTHHRLLDLLHRLGPGGMDPLASPFAPIAIAEPLIAMIENHGLEATCKMLGLSRAMQRELHEIDRELGRDVLIEMLGELFLEHIHELVPDADVPAPPPMPGGTKRRRAKSAPQHESDDDSSDQLDLF